MSDDLRAPHGALTITQFLDRYGIGLTKTYAEIGAGRLKAHRCGRRTLIRVIDAESWAASLEPFPARGLAVAG